MSTYLYRCQICGEDTEEDWPIGTAHRTARCRCGRPARLVIGAGVNISAEATPTSRGNVIAINQREKRFDKDGPAYKRMRHRGLQPDRIDGAADLENRVGDQDDIDYSRAIKVAEATGGSKNQVTDTVATLEVTHAG